jgi:hypothetical protein
MQGRRIACDRKPVHDCNLACRDREGAPRENRPRKSRAPDRRGCGGGLLPSGRAASLAVLDLGIGVFESDFPCAGHGPRIARRGGRYSGCPSVRTFRRQGDSLPVATPTRGMNLLGGQPATPVDMRAIGAKGKHQAENRRPGVERVGGLVLVRSIAHAPCVRRDRLLGLCCGGGQPDSLSGPRTRLQDGRNKRR